MSASEINRNFNPAVQQAPPPTRRPEPPPPEPTPPRREEAVPSPRAEAQPPERRQSGTSGNQAGTNRNHDRPPEEGKGDRVDRYA